MDIDLNELEDFSPEQIAEKLFTSEPKPPCSCSLVTEEEATLDLTWWFEILVIILLEGLNILTGNLSDANLDNLTTEHITLLNPWFQSLGFKIKVKSYDKTDEDDKQFYSKYYCRVILRDKLQETFFIMKNVSKNYHFVLNGSCLEENRQKTSISDLYMIFQNNVNVFKINFEFHYPDIKPEKII